jgi:iron complex transport system substrate-binding protein
LEGLKLKKFIGLIISIALIAGLSAGCSGTPAEDADTPENSQAASEVNTPETSGNAEEAAWPRTITDAAGNEVVLEKAPERISLLHIVYMEYFLLLDLPPTAAAIGNALGEVEALEESEMFGPYLKDTDMEVLGSTKDLSLEALLASDPDIIVSFYFPAGLENYDQLAAIAPVVQINYNDSWQEQLKFCARLLGKEAESEAIIKELEDTIADTKEALAPYAERSFGIFRTVDGKSFNALGGAQYYEIFGLTKPTGFTDAVETVSLEAVADMNPYYIVFQHNYDTSKALVDSMSSSSVWQSLDAVKNGRIYYFDENMNSFGPLALRLAAEKLVKMYSE